MATSAIVAEPEHRKLASALSDVFDDPVLFVHRVLRHKTWKTQDEILRSVATKRLTAVKGCHASSKTFSVAELVLFWLAKYDDGVVFTTGPTARQVRLNVWKEIREALRTSLLDYGVEPTLTEMHIGEKNYAVGFTTRGDPTGEGATKLQGGHGGHVLIVVDEAPGVEASVWNALEGLRAGGVVHVVVIGNPTHPTGRFYEIFTTESHLWNCFTIDAVETPNLEDVQYDFFVCDRGPESENGDAQHRVYCDSCRDDHRCRSCKRPREEHLREMPLDDDGPLDDNKFPSLITRRYVRERLDAWGETNPQYESRVRARFPQQAEGALLPLEWLEQARWREHVESNQRYSAGVDVAEAGEDETCLYVVDRGHIVAPPTVSLASDARGDIVAGLNPYKSKMGEVRYDALGVGAYFGPHLRDQGYAARAVKVSWKARKPKAFERIRDELYWDLRSLFESGSIANLTDDTTRAQLAGIRYEQTPSGKIHVESKKELRKRTGARSPDRADTLMLATTLGASHRNGEHEQTDDFSPMRRQVRLMDREI